MDHDTPAEKQRRQCKACPWRTSIKPERDIPSGYCATKHVQLKRTIAEPGTFTIGPMRVMACHESPPGAEEPCVGWVINQLGPGNNFTLRMAAMDGRFNGYRTVGDQHERFEDTLPRSVRGRVGG